MTQRFSPPTDLSGYDAFIFDCDGTLADSMPPHFLAWREGLQAAGATFEFTWAEFLSRAGMSMQQTVAELSERYGCSIDIEILAQKKAEVFDGLSHSIPAIDVVVNFAREVAAKFPVAVASGSSRQNVVFLLEQIGVAPLFEIIITPEDVTHGKPDPEMFLLAAQKMGVSPERCLVLEDGASGVEAAKRAGMDCAIVAAAQSID